MISLGHTRSARALDHLLQTPDTFVRASLPGMTRAMAIVHAATALGARFTQYTAEFEPSGQLRASTSQRFAYVLAGTISFDGHVLDAGGFGYAPAGGGAITARTAAQVAIIEKRYDVLEGAKPPAAFAGTESRVVPTLLGDDPGLEVRALVPDDVAFDFRVNTMTYQPGATLPAVEIHVMEHGLLMLEGGGIYRLGSSWYPVTAGDFIWMAPYCPQWFGALGKVPAKYLIYKDWDRHPRASAPAGESER